MKYISTRDSSKKLNSFSDVVMEGLATDGGLYVPINFPKLSNEELDNLCNSHYVDIAHRVILPFVGEDIDSDILYGILKQAYSNFYNDEIALFKKLENNIYVLELFHGPTLAFKDFALQFLGHMFDYLLENQKQKLTIIGATSGDTGSAAIEACRDKENLEVFILHPNGRVSEVQRRQMTTILSSNIHNIAIDGSFDDCQALVKAMFNDKEFRAEKNLSAINSINWGRIVAQIAYYVFAYIKLRSVTGVDSVSFSVPTGNFGNIYAGYIASKMGIPIDRLIIGTNSNDILFRFLETGHMKTGVVTPTISPSMDIQISSNFERVLFNILERDADKLADIMRSFTSIGEFSLGDDLVEKLQHIFTAYRFSDRETEKIITDIYNKYNYTLDPHSAIGIGAASKYLQDVDSKNSSKIISLATAEPAKFPDAVKRATGIKPKLPDKLSSIMQSEEQYSILPNNLDIVKEFILEN